MKTILYTLLLIFGHQFVMAQTDDMETIDKNLARLQQHIPDTARVSAMVNLCWLYKDADLEKAVNYAGDGLKLAKSIDNPKLMAECQTCLGWVKTLMQKKEEALGILKEALVNSRKGGNHLQIADVYNSIGWAYLESADQANALENYLNGYRIGEKYNGKKAMADACASLAELYTNRGDLINARHYAEKALDIDRSRNKVYEIANDYITLSSIEFKDSNCEASIKYLNLGIPLLKQSGDNTNLSVAYQLLGGAYSQTGKFQEALHYLGLSEKLARDMGYERGLQYIIQGTAMVYEKQGQYRKAIPYREKAIAMARNKELPDLIMLNLGILSTDYEKMGDYTSALRNYRESVSIRDSIVTMERDKAFQEIQSRFESEKKDRELEVRKREAERQRYLLYLLLSGLLLSIAVAMIFYQRYQGRQKQLLRIQEQNRIAVLESELNEQKRQKEVVQQMAEMKMTALRAQMNPHFLFNSLNAVQQFVAVQAREDALRYLGKFAKLMRMILQHAPDKEIILDDELEMLRMYLDLESVRFPGKFSWTMETDPDIDIHNTSIPPMLIQPFVENAIIHGFTGMKQTGILKIHFSRQNDSLYCLVEDNGIGREKSAEINKNKTDQFPSLATRISVDRLKTLNELFGGESFFRITDLKNEHSEAIGTRVEIRLPMG